MLLPCGLVTSTLLLVGCVDSGGGTSADAVVTMTADSFARTVAANPRLLVLFHAPWCMHCKLLMPEWQQAARHLKGKIVLAKVDAIQEVALARRYSVERYPTIKLLNHGKAEEYSGGLDAMEIVEWANSYSVGVQALDLLISRLPRKWPFQPTANFTLDDLMEQRPYRTGAFALTVLLYPIAGIRGLWLGSEPRCFSWLLCYFGLTSFLHNVVLIGRPLVGLLKPYDLTIQAIFCAFGACRLLVLLSRHEATELWAASILALAAVCMLRSASDARSAGDQDTFILHHGLWNVLSTIVATIIVEHSYPRRHSKQPKRSSVARGKND